MARRIRRAFARRRRAPTATATGAAGRVHHAAMQSSALLQSRATRSEVARRRCSWLIGKGSCVLGKARAPGVCTPPPRPTATASGAEGRVHHTAMQPSAPLHRRATRSEVARCRCSWLIGKGSCVLGKARAARRARQAFARRRHAPTTTATGAASRVHHAAIHRRATRSDVDRTHLDHAVAHPAGRRNVALPAHVATPGRASRNSVRSVAGARSCGVPVAVAPRRRAGPFRCHALPRRRAPLCGTTGWFQSW